MHTVSEPLLRPEDQRVWDRWRLTAKQHSRTLAYRRRVDNAKMVAHKCLDLYPSSVLMWSGGKDSTCMTHLVLNLHPTVPVISEKDDLDYPGELTYVQNLAHSWGADLKVITPDVSPSQWLAEHAHELTICSDVHSRAAQLSKECFYGLVEEANRPYDGVFLGLRKGESKARQAHLQIRGSLYQRADGKHICCPLADWEGLDVYAYSEVHDVPLFVVYRCVAFMHSREPWRLRKSWWLPGSTSAHGAVAWLRHYWPSLYARLVEWIPRAQGVG